MESFGSTSDGCGDARPMAARESSWLPGAVAVGLSRWSALKPGVKSFQTVWHRMHSERLLKRQVWWRAPPGELASLMMRVVSDPFAGTRSASVWASFHR